MIAKDSVAVVLEPDVAARKGIAYQTYVRMLLREALQRATRRR